MSAAIGDLQWLKQSLKSRRRKIQEISYDKNVSELINFLILYLVIHTYFNIIYLFIAKFDISNDYIFYQTHFIFTI